MIVHSGFAERTRSRDQIDEFAPKQSKIQTGGHQAFVKKHGRFNLVSARRKPNPVKSLVFVVANSVTPCLRRLRAVRIKQATEGEPLCARSLPQTLVHGRTLGGKPDQPPPGMSPLHLRRLSRIRGPQRLI